MSAYLYTRGGAAPLTDFHSRMFASPGSGVGEDPATGSATASLPIQLLSGEHLNGGTHVWQLEQGCEMGRPSQLTLEADVADSELKEIRVGGHAVIVSQGTIEI